MRTVTAKRVFEAAVRMVGLDPDTATLTTAQKARVAELVNDRVYLAWEAAFFQETMLVEQREYAATYAAGTTYADGDVVYYSGHYYESEAGSNVGHTPDSSPTWWTNVDSTTIRQILFEQTGETVIHRIDPVQAVYDKDPRIYEDAGCMRNVRLLDDRILVRDEEAPLQPWIKFQTRPREYSWTEWSSITTYATGDLVYYATTGHSYKALQASTNQNPSSQTSYWEAVGVPYFLLTYLKHGVAADMQQEDDGMFREDAKAEEELQRLLDAHESGFSNRVAQFG